MEALANPSAMTRLHRTLPLCHRRFRLLCVGIPEHHLSHLVSQYCDVEHAHGYEGATASVQRAIYDAVLVDLDTLDSISADICDSLQSGRSRLPIIALSMRVEDENVVQALESGVTDYVTYPVSSAVVLARVGAHVRDFEEAGLTALKLGALVFWPRRKFVKDAARGSIVRLSEKEANLLLYLYRNRNKWVHARKILTNVWYLSPYTSTHTVETHIYRLRRKLEITPEEPALILHSLMGYRLSLDSDFQPTGDIEASGELPVRRNRSRDQNSESSRTIGYENTEEA